MQFEFLIAWSHLRSRRQDAGVSLIAVLSVLGVTLGVQMLIIVLSVMAGFEIDLRDKILGSSAHMVVLSYEGPLANPETVLPAVEASDGVVAASPFTFTEVMLRSSFATTGSILKGFDPERTPKVTGVAEDLKLGPDGPFADEAARLALLKSLHEPPRTMAQDVGDTEVIPGIILGEGLADSLKVFPGDRVHVINPLGGGAGPMGMPIPQVKAFRVIGIFYTGMYEYDTKWAYVDNVDAQQFMQLGTSVTGIEARVEEDRLYDVITLGENLEAALHYPIYVRNWLTMNASLFSAMKLEKYVMGLILAQIITVAAVGIVTNLVVMVVTRAREISILKAMGASAAMIRLIFMIEGSIVGFVGTVCGTVLGLSGCYFLDQYRFPLDTNVYYLDSLPVVVEWQSVVAVVVASLVICFVATLYPASRAVKLDAVEGLRYE